jgi:queuine tRNA-ribosyltransferase
MVMNTFHLMQKPGSSTIHALGGLHRMSAWGKPIITDSGGFQAYSIVRQNPKQGAISDGGITFRPEGARRKYRLTPEKAVQLQMSYGTDVVICLDECTHVDDPMEVQRRSVDRTVWWAQRCKAEYLRLVNEKGMTDESRPLLFAVIEGGSSGDLRARCADEMLELGFDGYGYGGWPLDGEGNLLVDTLAYTRGLIPPEFPMHALGVGHPESIVECVRLGYDLFDSALPTRDARRGRLYTFTTEGGFESEWFKFLYVYDDKYIKDNQPISVECDCPTCSRLSRGYLHHLFKIKDTSFYRLATIHNLRFMTQLERRIRG